MIDFIFSRKRKRILCPKCKAVFDAKDPDYLYPTNRNKTEWCAACPYCTYYLTAATMIEADNLFRHGQRQ